MILGNHVTGRVATALWLWLASVCLAVAGAGAAVRVAVIGDYGENSPGELAVSNLVHSLAPEIVLTVGDNSYDGNPIDDNVGKYYGRYIGNYQGDYLPGSPINRFFPSLGNHDYSDGGGLPEYLDYFTLPGAGVVSSNSSGNERYYDVVYGPIHFFFLNSNAAEPNGNDSNSIQAQWLRTQLAASLAPWKIVLLHHAPFSSGASHGSTAELQWPYRDWGADAVIAGHDHVYERFVFDGFPYFVNGIGGRSLRTFGTIQPGSVVRYNADSGAMLLTADASHLTFDALSVSPGDSLVDAFTLYRNAGPPPDLAVSPPGIAFGNVVLGKASVRMTILHNNGPGELTVGELVVGGAHGADFEVRSGTGSAPKRLPSLSAVNPPGFRLQPGDSVLVAVRFAPASLGAKSAFLRVVSNDPDESTADFFLSGSASLTDLASPDIEIDPPALALGDTPVQTQSTGSVWIHNRGTEPLHGSVALTGTGVAHFAILAGAGAFSLAPTESLTVAVRFAPTTTGLKTANLHIVSDDPDEPDVDVTLIADALEPLEPHLDPIPDSLHCGTVVVQTSATANLYVHNPGTGTLRVTSVALLGANAAEFAILSGGGSFNLIPGAVRTITVRFAPVTLGNKTASLRLASNDPDIALTFVPLTGVGRPPPVSEIEVAANLDFGGAIAPSGTATQALVVRNTGEAALAVSAMSVFGPAAADFSVLAGGAPFAVDPGDSAVVQLRFAPGTAGAKSATLRIQSNDPQHSTQDVVLTAIAIASQGSPASVVFQETVDGSSTNSITVTTSRSVTAASNATYLAAVSSRGPVAVASVTGMGLTWTPVRAQCGGRQQTMVELWVGTGTPSAGPVVARFASTPSSAVIAVTCYGGTGTPPFTVVVSGNTNGLNGGCGGGTDATSFSLPLTTTAPNAVVFAAVALRNRSVSPGSGYALREDVRAGSGGWISGLVTLERAVPNPTTVSVNGTFSSDVDWALVAVALVPTVAYPEISVTPTSYAFGTVPLGETRTTTVAIRNDGAGNLHVPSVGVQGPNAAEFTLTSGVPVPELAPGAQHTLSLRFAPGVAAARAAVLRIVSDDPNEVTLDLPLTGAGVAAIPDIVVAPSALDFGSIPAATSTSQSLQLSNHGVVPLLVSQVRVTGADSLAFSWSGTTVPFAIDPGDSLTLGVTFAPATQGAKTAVLRLVNNDPDSGILDLPLAGTALAPLVPDIAVGATTLDFGTVAVLTNTFRTLVVRNVGTGSLAVNAPAVLGADASLFALASADAFTLAPGDSTTLGLTFTPTSAGTKSAQLRLTSNDPNESPLVVALLGTASVPPEGRVVFEGSVTGGASSKTSVTTTTSLAPAPGDLVLAAVTSKGYVNVTSVSGLGLTWVLVRAQCGARTQTGVQVWRGTGTASPGLVTATFASAPAGAVIVVARYSGVDPATPFGTIRSANTLGTSGACSGGTDTATYNLSVPTTVNDAMLFEAVAMRSRVLTAGSGFTQRALLYAGPDGSIAGLSVLDRVFDVPGTATVNGSFDGSVDWAVVGVELRPFLGAAKQAISQPAPVLEAGLVVSHGIVGAERFVELAAPQPSRTRVRLVDVRGRSLRILFDGILPAGRTRIPWGTTDAGRDLPSGVYFVHAEIGTQRFVRKALLLH